MFDNIVPVNGSPSHERLCAIVRRFATWQPCLKPLTPELEELAASAASRLGGKTVRWIAPVPGPVPLPYEVTLFWTYGTFDLVRQSTPREQWESLRELMSQRFMADGYGNLVGSLTPSQLEWFEHGNVHGLCANLEDLIKHGFCVGVLGASLGEELTGLLADLLELWSRGIYVVGIYRSRELVLLHGDEPQPTRQLES